MCSDVKTSWEGSTIEKQGGGAAWRGGGEAVARCGEAHPVLCGEHRTRRHRTGRGRSLAPYTRGVARRFRFRPPGLKPTTKIGTLGPYRGRLGLAWVIAPIVAGALIVIAGYLALTR